MQPEIMHRLKDASRLDAVSGIGLVPGNPPEDLRTAVRLAALALRAPSAAFLLLSGREFLLRASFGLPASLSGLSEWPLQWPHLLSAAFSGPFAASGFDAAVPEAGGTAGFPAPDLRAFLGAPILDRAGRSLGILAVWDRVPRVWTREESDLLLESAGMVAKLLEALAARPRGDSAPEASQSEIDTMLRTLDTPVIAYERNETVAYANDAATRMLGFSHPGELVGGNVQMILANVDVFDEKMRPFPKNRRPSLRAFESESPPGVMSCYRRKGTDEMRWVIIKTTPIRDTDGKVRLSLAAYQDVTGIKQAEASLNNHMRFLEGVNQVSGAIEGTADVEAALPAALGKLIDVFECEKAWLVPLGDPEGQGYRVCFSAAKGPVGRAAEASSDIDTIPPEARFDAIARACENGDEPLVFGRDRPMPNPEFWIRVMGAGSMKAVLIRPQASKPWILCMLRASGAEPWKAYELALFKDVSSRIATALGAILLHRELRRSEEKYRTLFEGSLDGIFRCSGEGVLLDANPALVAMLGYEDRNRLIGTVQKRLLPSRGDLSGVPEHGETFSVELTRLDGSCVWAEVSSRPVLRAEGDISRYEGIVRNITDRKRTEEALKASEEKLRQAQKMEAVGRLAGGVAHDFNNLLTAINGFSDLLLMSVGKEDARRAHLQEIRQAGERAAALTSQLLAFSRKQVLAPRVLDLNTVVGGMETMLRRLIGENIGFRTELHANLAKVVADPNQMEQVILNLVLNARDAMPAGGDLLVSTENRRLGEEERRQAVLDAPAGDYVRLCVRDTGGGMDQETMSLLFEPFFTTKPKDKGTGLGLSTVYGAVKQANGTIAVDSGPDRGTSFSIYLPASSGKEAKPGKTRLRERALRSIGGNETILLAEDEDAVRRLVRDVLEVGGYTVLEAPGGEQALELVENLEKGREIHLLLTDVVMGGMSGRELGERLKAVRPGIKVLYMSGYTEDAIIRHGVFTAQADFIGKPFTPAKLSAKVREVLDAAAEKRP